ncbi:MAG: UDP-N-acetylmuramoyl-tripeptide--D-alanyl-D-alanine ligase [Amphritea sp.]|nr:UDP-N-acetylmuramoyl-tripeptide--D-alanyl-D-alanine ligase [Amphritea sp.]
MNGPFSLQDLAAALSGKLAGEDIQILGVSTDTRSINEGDLFIALKGDNFDAHDFVAQASESGAVAAVVERELPLAIPQLIVTNTRLALGQIAAYNRERFNGSLFAVTGSGGKTTVKEMMASVNRLRGQTLATQGNLNNDIGVPLTLLRLSSGDQYAVIEMGANGPHEIAYSTGLAKPDVAILNNAMGAHLEGFGSLMGVVKAKAEIFNGLSEQGTAVINLDDPHVGYWRGMLLQQPTYSFSLNDSSATVYASDIEQQANGCYQFGLNYQGQVVTVRLGLMGRHNVANALAAAAATLADGCALQVVADGLAQCRGAAGRMQPTTLTDNTLLIDDSYNANPDAVKAAVNALIELSGESVLVLGDMGELGADEQEQHYGVGQYAAEHGVNRLYACGTLSEKTVQGFKAQGGHDGLHFEDQKVLCDALQQLPSAQRNILVKGSRSAKMDNVVAAMKAADNNGESN